MGSMDIAQYSMDFSKALAHLRDGEKLSRSAWGDYGIFVVLQPGYPEGVNINKNTAEATGIPEGTKCVFKPYLMQRAKDGSFMPWTPSQEDVLGMDWHLSDWWMNQDVAPSEVAASVDTPLPHGIDYNAAMAWAARGYKVSRDAWGGTYVYFSARGLYGSGISGMRSEGGYRWVSREADRSAEDWYVMRGGEVS